MDEEIKRDINKAVQPFVNADEALANQVQEAADTDIESESPLMSNLVREISNKFELSERSRQGHEQRWLQAFRNFRGLYGKTQTFRETEKSRVFVKITKTKVLAAYGQLIDVVFAAGKFPISVAPTVVPTGIAKYAHLPQPGIETGMENKMVEQTKHPLDVGYAGDGMSIGPGSVLSEDPVLGGLKDKYKGATLLEGPSNDPKTPQISPSKEAARNMEKLIHDQIEESNGATELRNSMFECCLLGTGIIKGPFNYKKTIHKWKELKQTNPDGEEDTSREYAPETVKVPHLEFVSLWNFYPDPNATCMEEAEWVINRHKLNRSQLKNLKNNYYFNGEAIDKLLVEGSNYVSKDFETFIQFDENSVEPTNDRYEVLEYWGIMDGKTVVDAGMELPDDVMETDDIQINAWVSGGKVLRLVANPFKPVRIPFLVYPYEKNPYSIFGVGVAENMDDAQQIMNGHVRMAIDNLAISGNLILDVDETALVPGQSMEVYAGKIFKRQAGMPGQAVYGIKLPTTTTENMMMFDKFRQLADEATGMPSYSHGQTGIQSTTRTAAGISMLMGAASLNIKTVVKNLDDFLLKPLGEAFFQWNMGNYEGSLPIIGDMDVKATGTSSLIQKEVRSQRLNMFLQTIQNPMIAPFVKIPVLIKEIAESLDLDPEELVNDIDQAQIMASIMAAGAATQAQQQPQGMPGEVATQDTAMPGEPQFSDNGQMPPDMGGPIG